MKRLLLAAPLLLAFASSMPVAAQSAQTPAEICANALPAAEPQSRDFARAEQVLEPGVDYRAIFCTEAGPIYVDLFEEYTPITVNNFVFLAQQGYYNNTTFHRVIENFMAQGGDPTGTGTGGPGYQFQDEFVGFLNFDAPGWLAMANAGPQTNGSQFFITTAPTPHLNFRHTIFGEVLEGQANVEAIKLRDPQTAIEPGTALQTIVIVTDPAQVATSYQQPAPAAQADVIAAFEKMSETITPDVADLLKQETQALTTEETVATAAEGIRADYARYLERHQHEYRVSNTVTNIACDLENLIFSAITYTLDSFADRDAAQAALADEFAAQFPLQNGFTEAQTSENLPNPLFTVREQACGQEVIRAMTSWQRGHFVATASIVMRADDPNVQYLDLILSQFVGMQIYEAVIASVLRGELR